MTVRPDSAACGATFTALCHARSAAAASCMCAATGSAAHGTLRADTASPMLPDHRVCAENACTAPAISAAAVWIAAARSAPADEIPADTPRSIASDSVYQSRPVPSGADSPPGRACPATSSYNIRDADNTASTSGLSGSVSAILSEALSVIVPPPLCLPPTYCGSVHAPLPSGAASVPHHP